MANNLNITTANFGNDADKFFLYSPAMYIDLHDGAGLVGLGYLQSELSFKQKIEYAMFKTGIPKTEVRRDIIDQEFTLEGTLMQIQPETLALIMQRWYDETDSTYNRVIIGSVAPTPVYPSVVLIGQMVNQEELRLYIRRLQITAEDLEIKLGGDNYSSLPFKGTAQVDSAPLTTNSDWAYTAAKGTQDNIAFWAVAKSFSSTT
jgi:hypothetical protein